MSNPCSLPPPLPCLNKSCVKSGWQRIPYGAADHVPSPLIFYFRCLFVLVKVARLVKDSWQFIVPYTTKREPFRTKPGGCRFAVKDSLHSWDLFVCCSVYWNSPNHLWEPGNIMPNLFVKTRFTFRRHKWFTRHQDSIPLVCFVCNLGMDNLVTPWINVHIASYKLFIELVFYVETLTTALVCAWSSQLSSSRVINVGTKNALGVFFFFVVHCL